MSSTSSKQQGPGRALTLYLELYLEEPLQLLPGTKELFRAGGWQRAQASPCARALPTPQAHLALGGGDRCPPGVDVLVDAGEEVLGDAEGVLQQGVVRVVSWGVLEEILEGDRHG